MPFVIRQISAILKSDVLSRYKDIPRSRLGSRRRSWERVRTFIMMSNLFLLPLLYLMPVCLSVRLSVFLSDTFATSLVTPPFAVSSLCPCHVMSRLFSFHHVRLNNNRSLHPFFHPSPSSEIFTSIKLRFHGQHRASLSPHICRNPTEEPGQK